MSPSTGQFLLRTARLVVTKSRSITILNREERKEEGNLVRVKQAPPEVKHCIK
jgi:hypothetical protein